MKLNLEFNQLHFQYNSSIIVGKNHLPSNKALQIKSPEFDSITLISLPGFHQHSLNEWQFMIDTFFKEEDLDLSNINLEKPFFNTINKSSAYYSLSNDLLFAIEAVLFKVIQRYCPEKLSFFSETALTIKVNNLYHPAMKTDFTKIDCLKIKIRPTAESLQQTITVLKNGILKNSKIQFRLDGNRTFDLIDLINFTNEIQFSFSTTFIDQINYFEEPLKNFYDSFIFQKMFHYNLGFDESILTYQNNLEKLGTLPPHSTLILKPSMLGISKCLEIMKNAQRYNFETVISSTYESPSCFAILQYLTSLSPSTTHGLDTLKFLPNL